MKRKTFAPIAALSLFAFCAILFPASADADKGDGAAGRQSFATICASCHGESGKGDGVAAAALNPKPRDLSDGSYLSKLTDEYLFNVISKGGVAVGKSAMMPAWGAVLGEQGTWNVVAHIRENICECEFAR